MNMSTPETYTWLTSAAATPWLSELASVESITPATVESLRRRLSPTEVSAVLELTELRRRARAKFSRADAMYFTRQGLEQSTDELLSHYKSRSFPANGQVADLCCGIGGDLLGLAAHCHTIAYDLDPIMITIAGANLALAESNGSRVALADVESIDLSAFDAWHLDPDRRPTGSRTTHVAFHRPSAEAIEHMLRQCPHAMVKFSPAAEGTESWRPDAEFEWVGHDRECQQLVVRFGDLARSKGVHTATVLDGAEDDSFSGDPHERLLPDDEAGLYLIEPAAPVRAAGLTASFARSRGLSLLSSDPMWLTAAQPITSRLVSNFRVLDQLALDRKRVSAYLRHHELRIVEVKSRERSAPPESLLRQWQQPKGMPVSLIVIRLRRTLQVFVTQRIVAESS